MGYRRREPDKPTSDDLEAVVYMRSRAGELGLRLQMSDSRLRQLLRNFICKRLKMGIYYSSLVEAAKSYWTTDEPFFKVFALIFKIAKEKR